MTRAMVLVAAVVCGAISRQAAFAQSATKLSEICGDCVTEALKNDVWRAPAKIQPT